MGVVVSGLKSKKLNLSYFMIIIKLSGGLGNQMFEYAFGRALSLKYKQILLFDKSIYKKKNKSTPRKFFLNFFNVDILSFSSVLISKIFVIIDLLFIKLFKINFIKKEQQIHKYDDKLKISKFGINYFDGYWQCYKYFEEFDDIILEDFTPKIVWTGRLKEIDDKIVNSNSVSIHVRRGDYVGNKDYEVCSLGYYQKAIDFFEINFNNLVFYVFSDDIEWVKNNLKFKNASVIFISGSGFNEAEELILMSHCKHNIISNSSFSWWAAWLNKNSNKKVVIPDRWSNVEKLKSVPDLLPDSWLKVS
ncbi:MAG TPA: hypothetical protein DEB09_02490 [Candidatus Magasanikbacteria bacterium]|nr:hypothetical protein [Candidatus Magasanikbacteria bacterium]